MADVVELQFTLAPSKMKIDMENHSSTISEGVEILPPYIIIPGEH